MSGTSSLSPSQVRLYIRVYLHIGILMYRHLYMQVSADYCVHMYIRCIVSVYIWCSHVCIGILVYMPWPIDVKLDHCAEAVRLKVKRRQAPTVYSNASTLHVLQGTTCDPGLIFHWTFPKRLRKDLLWLAVYVVPFRVRSLRPLRLIGLTRNIKDMIEGGPSDSLPAQFEKYFSEAEFKTVSITEEAARKMGWELPAE